MILKEIKKLAKVSFINADLNKKIVLGIARYLNRGDLKKYIKVLKDIEKQNTIKVSVSNIKIAKSIKKELLKVFKFKKIKIEEDKSLIAGIKIQNYDDIYEYNLKNTIKHIVDYIAE